MAKDYLDVFPKVMSDFMENIEIIEGDGGVGSVLFIQLGYRGGRTMKTQKEKIMELDEVTNSFGLEVIGVMLKKGYSSFKTSFKLKPEGEGETVVKVVFGLDGDDDRQLQFKENAT